MNLRQRNFFLTKNINNFFSKNKNNIYLFVHVNDLNTLEQNWINLFCKNKNIISLNVKTSLYKKMIKNKNFENLTMGPTRIFQFQDFTSFLNFFEFINIKKKFIPLAVYWNLNFYSYYFFQQYLTNNLKINSNFIDKLPLGHNKLLLEIKQPLINVVVGFNYNNLFLLLNILLKNKQ